MRPLATSQHNDRAPFAAKCFRSAAGGLPQSTSKRSTPAPRLARILRPIVSRLSQYPLPPRSIITDINRPFAGSAAQIFARQIILRLLFHALLAIDDKFVQISRFSEAILHTELPASCMAR